MVEGDVRVPRLTAALALMGLSWVRTEMTKLGAALATTS